MQPVVQLKINLKPKSDGSWTKKQGIDDILVATGATVDNCSEVFQ